MDSLFLFLFFLQLFNGVCTLLLQVNKVYTASLVNNETISIDISLFQACPDFTILFTTEKFDTTRVNFHYANSTLSQIDVDSLTIIPAVVDPVKKECKERARKGLVMKIISVDSHYRISVGGQIFNRYRSNDEETLKIYVPPQTPCCLIRAILFEEGGTTTTTLPGLVPKASYDGKLYVKEKKFKERGDPFAKKEIESDGSDEETTTPYEHPTPVTYAAVVDEEIDEEEEFKKYSWTRQINERWIGAAFVFGGAVTVILMVFTCFGLVMFLCLQTVPKDRSDQIFCSCMFNRHSLPLFSAPSDPRNSKDPESRRHCKDPESLRHRKDSESLRHRINQYLCNIQSFISRYKGISS